MSTDPSANDRSSQGPSALGGCFVALFVLACIAGAWFLWQKDAGPSGGPGRMPGGDLLNREPVTVGIAYGTEKKRWLEWAVDRFAEDDDGRGIEIDLLPMGSLEGAQALLTGDERIHVWSPASDLYTDTLVQDWRVKHGGDPFLRSEALALTPMVFVMWKERYQAFIERYGSLDFDSLHEALREPSGWAAIAERPAWGLFKFGHTHPNRSNSGLATLVLMAHHHAGTSGQLTMEQILDSDFQTWLREIESAVAGLSPSTGTMMRDMVLKGPASYDVLFVYESVAIDYLENAEGRWGSLQVVYPPINLWNSNPTYILDAPWSSAAQHEAAGVFLDFLLREDIQAQALVHGFRPGNPQVPVRTADGPFARYADYGLAVQVPEVIDPPPKDVVQNLLAGWERFRAR